MSQDNAEDAPHEVDYGPVRVLFGQKKGSYPEGNTLWIRGERESVLMDPAVGLHDRKTLPEPVDRVILSHFHEDHVAGLSLFPEIPVHVHRLDKPGLDDRESMRAFYGYPPAVLDTFTEMVEKQFHYEPRPDALSFEDGAVFDLGGVRIRAIHTPGHTRGHCCLMVEWEEKGEARRFLYLGDIELTTFGPYYGDAWSDLVDFEESLKRIRPVEADWFGTFHHIGVLEGQEAFLERLDVFEGAIERREKALLEFLTTPHTLDEIVEHRFVFRPGTTGVFHDAAEMRSMTLHLERLMEQGQVVEEANGFYRVS